MYKSIKPEAYYKATEIREEEIIPFVTSVVGTVTRFDIVNRNVIVELGCSWTGIIPENEIGIYDFTYAEGKSVPYQITGIIGRQIRAIVTEIKEGNVLKLSRKISMQQTWEELQEGSEVLACITRNTGKGIFYDIGNGLQSYSSIIECMALRISSTKMWYKTGQYIKVKIIEKGYDPKCHTICSVKYAYPSIDELAKILNIGDIIAVRIGQERIENGYFCKINPRVCGIINTDEVLHEGDVVKGIVKKITEKGVKLTQIPD